MKMDQLRLTFAVESAGGKSMMELFGLFSVGGILADGSKARRTLADLVREALEKATDEKLIVTVTNVGIGQSKQG
jgi:hypothetical protein